MHQTNRYELQRIGKAFEQRASAFDVQLAATLDQAMGAVHTLADYYRVNGAVPMEQFGRLAEGQLHRAPGVRALAWVPRIPADQLDQYQSMLAAEGAGDGRVYELDVAGGRRPAQGRPEYFPVTRVWPLADHEAALGFDLGSDSGHRQTLGEAGLSGQLRLSGRVELVHGCGQGVLAAIAVPGGFIIGIIVLEKLIDDVAAATASQRLMLTLLDETAAPGLRTLYAGAGPGADAAMAWSATHALGGRRWTLQVSAAEDYLRAHRSVQAWVTQVGVLMFSVLLGGFLMVLTGKSARVERQVAERTAELEDKNRALLREVAERSQAEGRLRLSAAVFEHIGEAIMITDADNRIVSVNRAFTSITGYSADEVVGQQPSMLSSGRHDHEFYRDLWKQLHVHGIWSGEVWDRRKNGEIYPQWLTISLVRDGRGRVTHHVAVFSDMTERKAVEERIRHLAQVDALTNLPNRYLLADRLQQVMETAGRSGNRFAVMFIDIDRFKNINDSLGHGVGDALLRDVAARLRASVRAVDTVARQGGDEFVIIVPDPVDAEHVAQVARKVLAAVVQPLRIEQHLLGITASIGIALYPDDGTDVESLLKHADAAMYAAKAAGRNGFRFFTADMNARVQEFLRTENELRRALARGELRLYYQPQFDTVSGDVVAMEALVRWQHPERGLLLPGQFIHVAEESGLISAIGDWVLHEACYQNRVWQERGLRQVPVCVNLSAVELHRSGIAAQVARVLHETGLAPQWLELEITESMLMRDIELVGAQMRELRAMGVMIALDDFGTGYSSLAHLKGLPLNALKVDRSFVSDSHVDPNDAAICRAVIALGRTLGLRVIAEGVENEAQLVFLRENRCDTVQGALLSWGVPPAQMERFLQPLPA